jgi:hypothetical protein
VSTLYEYYKTGDDWYAKLYDTKWVAQTFTPSVAHKITSVKLKLYRTGSPGTITVSIRTTDGSGHPTGADLCSGTTDGNTLPEGSPYEWREITLGAGYNLSASTKYAIVARALSGDDVANFAQWRQDSSSPAYAGGNLEYSFNSGSSWTTDVATDQMFEEWGELGVTEKTSSDTGSGADGLTSGNPVATLVKAETGSGIDAVASGNPLATLVRAETGFGVDVFVSLEQVEAKTSSDAGSGVEGIPVPSALLAGSETGSSIDAIIARLLTAVDTGYGVEVGSVEVGGLLEELFASELGQGIDALVVKREIFAGGEGTKFFGGGHKPPHRAS